MLPGSLMPESNVPSSEPGVPDVTECGSPLNVQRITSPTLTEREAGWNWKFTTATLTVAASADRIPANSRPAIEAATIKARRTAPVEVLRGVIEEPYDASDASGSLAPKPLARGERKVDAGHCRPQRS